MQRPIKWKLFQKYQVQLILDWAAQGTDGVALFSPVMYRRNMKQQQNFDSTAEDVKDVSINFYSCNSCYASVRKVLHICIDERYLPTQSSRTRSPIQLTYSAYLERNMLLGTPAVPQSHHTSWCSFIGR